MLLVSGTRHAALLQQVPSYHHPEQLLATAWHQDVQVATPNTLFTHSYLYLQTDLAKQAIPCQLAAVPGSLPSADLSSTDIALVYPTARLNTLA